MGAARASAQEIAATLSPAMAAGLTYFHRHGYWGDVRVGTRCALLDRDLIGHSRQGVQPDLITGTGFAVLAQLGATESDAARGEALEFAEVIAYDQVSYANMLACGATPEIATANVRWFRDATAALPCSFEADSETRRYYELVKKHGVAIPFVLTPSGD